MSSGNLLLVAKGQVDLDAFRRPWSNEAEGTRVEKRSICLDVDQAGTRKLASRLLPRWSFQVLLPGRGGDPGQEEQPPQRSTVGRRPKPSAEIVQAPAICWDLDATAHKPLAAHHRWFDIFVHNDLGSYVERARRKELYSRDAMRSHSPVWGEIDEYLIEFMKYLCAPVRKTERAKPSAPWQLDSTQIDVVETYEAEVVGEVGEEYVIEFADYDGGTVEARLGKHEFQGFPYPVEEGTYFGIVVYRRKGQPGTTASLWPVAEHWHPSLQELPDAE